MLNFVPNQENHAYAFCKIVNVDEKYHHYNKLKKVRQKWISQLSTCLTN